jgi:hypothetical protein
VNPQGIAALLPVGEPERLAPLLERLNGGESPFARLEHVHFARLQLATLADERGRHLLLGAEFDGTPAEFLDDLLRLPEVDPVFACCDGYPGAGAPVAFRAWVLEHHVRAGFSVHGNLAASVREIRESLALRSRIAAFALATRGLEPQQFAARWREEWGEPGRAG